MKWAVAALAFLAGQYAALRVPRPLIEDKRHFFQILPIELSWLLHAVDVTDDSTLRWLLKTLTNSQWPYLNVYRFGEALSGGDDGFTARLLTLVAAEPQGEVASIIIGNHCEWAWLLNPLHSAKLWPFLHLPIFLPEFDIDIWDHSLLINLLCAARLNPQLWTSMKWAGDIELAFVEYHLGPSTLDFLNPEYLSSCSTTDKVAAARLLFSNSTIFTEARKAPNQAKIELGGSDILWDLRILTRFQFSTLSIVGLDVDPVFFQFSLACQLFLKDALTPALSGPLNNFTVIARAMYGIANLDASFALKALSSGGLLNPLALSPNNRATGTSVILELFILALCQASTMDREIAELFQSQLAITDFSLLVPVSFVTLLDELQRLDHLHLIRPYFLTIRDNLPLLAAISRSGLPIFGLEKMKQLLLALTFPGTIMDMMAPVVRRVLGKKPTIEAVKSRCTDYLASQSGQLDNMVQLLGQTGRLGSQELDKLQEIANMSIVLVILRVPNPLDVRALISENYIWNNFVGFWSLSLNETSLSVLSPQELAPIIMDPKLLDELPDVRFVSRKPYDPTRDPEIMSRPQPSILTMSIQNPYAAAGQFGIIEQFLGL